MTRVARFSSAMRGLRVAASLALLCLVVAPVEAAEETRDILYTYFETGDVPTEQQFGDLIDSFLADVNPSATFLGSVDDGLGQGALFSANTEIGPGLSFSQVAGLGEAWVGESGFLPLQFGLNGQTHYGYLQITSATDDQYPMFVEYLVYETDPNTAILTTTVPEPSTVVMLGLGGLLVAAAARGKWRWTSKR